ncbi:MAG TPA: hypothetical protein VLX91_02535 [Candidatus Acidoferrales bacterium]|nr:hypothetical protein [Candidatus Acidoferrales bacterium]
MTDPVRDTMFIIVLILGMMTCTSSTRAQLLRVTAKVTVTVISGPGINFTPANQTKSPSSLNQTDGGGMTFHAATTAAVTLNFDTGGRILHQDNLRRGVTRILTAEELEGVSKVQVTYIGS